MEDFKPSNREKVYIQVPEKDKKKFKHYVMFEVQRTELPNIISLKDPETQQDLTIHYDETGPSYQRDLANDQTGEIYPEVINTLSHERKFVIPLSGTRSYGLAEMSVQKIDFALKTGNKMKCLVLKPERYRFKDETEEDALTPFIISDEEVGDEMLNELVNELRENRS